MSAQDDDLHLRVVGTPVSYFFGTQGPVLAAFITEGGAPVGAVWAGVDPTENAAGVSYRRTGDWPATGGAYWSGRLRALFASGAPAQAAVGSLLGQSGPAGAGVVSDRLVEVGSKELVDSELNPGTPRRSGRGDGRDQGSGGTRRTSLRDRVDAALRSETPMTDELLAEVRSLDEALLTRPTPEAVVVSMDVDRRRLPLHLVAGAEVVEPTFLRTRFFSRDRTPSASASEVEVVLRVPPGVPALFVDPAEGGGPLGTLLLARGLRWIIEDVVPNGRSTLVTGRVSTPAVPTG